jgi:hypothetical protein
MDRFVEVIGFPPEDLINNAPRKRKFYENNIFKGKRNPSSKTLQ